MPSVMVVEDEAIISLQLQERLKAMGYSVVGCATNGDDSVSLAKRLKPDLILMDIVMPGVLDGIDAARVIRDEMDIPVIFMTAWADDDFLKRAKTVNPYGYIVKPYHMVEVKAMIEVALHNKSIMREVSKTANQFHTLVNNMDDAFISADETGRILFWNRASLKLFGRSDEDISGMPIGDLVEAPSREAFDALIAIGLSGISHEAVSTIISFARANGAVFPGELTMVTHESVSGTSIICVIRDIEDQLVRYENHFKRGNSEIIPICLYCKKIRNSLNQWVQIERYLSLRFNIRFSHGICPECVKKIYPDLETGN